MHALDSCCCYLALRYSMHFQCLSVCRCQEALALMYPLHRDGVPLSTMFSTYIAGLFTGYANARQHARLQSLYTSQPPAATAAAAAAASAAAAAAAGTRGRHVSSGHDHAAAAAAPGSSPQAELRFQSSHLGQSDWHHAAAPLCCPSSGRRPGIRTLSLYATAPTQPEKASWDVQWMYNGPARL